MHKIPKKSSTSTHPTLQTNICFCLHGQYCSENGFASFFTIKMIDACHGIPEMDLITQLQYIYVYSEYHDYLVLFVKYSLISNKPRTGWARKKGCEMDRQNDSPFKNTSF